jgi:hypothetical protein
MALPALYPARLVDLAAARDPEGAVRNILDDR